MKKKYSLITGGILLSLIFAGPVSSFGQNGLSTGHRIPVDIPKHFPRVTQRPDLVITRIYSKKHQGSLGVWADIKNVGGPIPEGEFKKADMRFYLTYLKSNNNYTTGPITGQGNNGYKLSYLDRTGKLMKPGGMISAEAPGTLTCHGTVRVKVEVDLPISGGGRIKESNEHNNTKTAVLHCP